jgi:hypothetical protein
VAGNTAASVNSVAYHIDTHAPTIVCAVAPPAKASFILHQPGALVYANVSDATSGPSVTPASGAASTANPGTFSVSIAGYDVAGNTASVSCGYIVGYNFSGFYAPVDRPNALNISKAGQAIPLKWLLTDYFGQGVTNVSSVTVDAVSYACDLGTTGDQIEEYASGSSGLQNLGGGNYQFNWKTPTSYAKSCKSINLDFGGGVKFSPTALFSFTK